MMRILFIHQNFPGQFLHLAPILARNPQHEVRVLTMRKDVPSLHPRIGVMRYGVGRGTSATIQPWVADFETKVIRGEGALRAALQLKRQGYSPDVIVAHPGWGESLFLHDAWPAAKMGLYCEFYYGAGPGSDVGFDPEFPVADPEIDAARLRVKNANNTLHFEFAQAGLSPTVWQRSTFPEPFRSRITVAHDGVDTERVRPDAQARFTLPDGKVLSRSDEVITFVNRNLEPYRGYHVFMRSLPELMRRRPNAQVVIVGGNDVSYGARPPAGQTWKEIYLNEVAGQIDPSRLHFVGHVQYPNFLKLLQVSTVHVYLTYPFVLSWSLIEAMSTGCAIVASRTAPLLEAIEDGRNGVLVDFFDRDTLVDAVAGLCEQPERRALLGAAARADARAKYDLQSVCLPAQKSWVEGLVS